MYCKYCGEEITDNSVFCKYCGKRVKEESTQENTEFTAADENADTVNEETAEENVYVKDIQEGAGNAAAENVTENTEEIEDTFFFKGVPLGKRILIYAAGVVIMLAVAFFVFVNNYPELFIDMIR